MNAPRRRFVLVALIVGILIFAGLALFWHPEEPPEKPGAVVAARDKAAAAVRSSPVRTRVKPAGPSAKPLVDSIATKVGAGFAGSALASGRVQPAAYRMMEYPEGKPYFAGEAAVAFVSVPSSGDNVAIEPNQMGEFPRIYANPGETVDVRVVFPDTAAGTKVRIVAEDGGTLPGKDAKPAVLMELDGGKSFAVPFTLGTVEGAYRLTIATAEGDPKRLHLWAGSPMR